MTSIQMMPLTQLTNEADSIFRHIGETDEPLILSLDGRPAVVVQDYERYEKTRTEELVNRPETQTDDVTLFLLLTRWAIFVTIRHVRVVLYG